MRAKRSWAILGIAVVALTIGLWVESPRLTQADPRGNGNGSGNGKGNGDIYRTLVTGLAGTPMPSYGDALEPDQTWDLVYYVLSLSRNGGRAAETGR